VAATSTVLSLADLERFDPEARPGDREQRFLCPLCGVGKPRDDRRRWLRVEKATGLWHCKHCDAGGLLREWWTAATHRPRGMLRSLGAAASRERGACTQRRARELPTPAPGPSRHQASDGEQGTPGGGHWQQSVPLAGSAGEAYLARRGIPVAVAQAAGVSYSSDWYGRPAVLFPLRDEAGTQVGAQGRYLDGREPKARTSQGATGAVFVTPGAWDAGLLVLCEGPIDALSLAAGGRPAVALLGGRFPAWLPRACAFRRVLLAHDADAVGDAAAEKLAVALPAFGARGERLRPSGAKDWNDLLLAHGAEALHLALTAFLCPTQATLTPVEAQTPEELLVALYRRVGRTLPAGTIRWADANRPDLMAAVDAAEAQVQAAYEAAEATALSSAVADLWDAFVQVGAAFRARSGAPGSGQSDPGGAFTDAFAETRDG
jgi:hypothetical protein